VRRDYSYPLRVAADKYAARTAFVHGDERWTYRDVDRATDRLAAAFEARGLTGRRAVLLLQNEPLTVMVNLALARAGAVSVPVNPRLLPDELAFVVDDCAAAAIVADAAFVDVARDLRARCATVDRLLTVHVGDDGAEGEPLEDLLGGEQRAPVADVDPDAVATVIYTSGTSGVPKGVARSHDANLWACVNAALGQPRTAADTEVFVLPLFGIAFMFQVMPMLLSGGTVVLDGAFDPVRTWTLLERHRATRVFLAPTMISSMLAVDGHERHDVSALRVLNTAYEFPPPVRERTVARFGPIVAYMYGLTEAQLCCSTPAEFAADPTDAGHAMGMMRIRAVDEAGEPVAPGVVGELAFEGPSLMSGYLGRDEATADVLADGWLSTGDLGFVDDEGRVHVTGRKKEMIKTGGFSVDPVEVEQALLGYAGVDEAAVVGVPDEHWGEQIVAFVAGTDGTDEAAAALLAYAKTRIAGFKCPKRVVFVDALPKNPTGKIERARLRARAAETA
jgi:fatty-acyl-CoA synthase